MSFRVYCNMDQRMPLSGVPERARRAEALGYDGLCVPEAVHDGLAAATLALHATRRLRVATSVLVAFPRSPMTTAVAAWDLQEMSGGRFELGLGSQVRGNIVGRYGVEWTPPAPRMREYVGAVRAVFECWQKGGELRFEGEHYRLTRMQPFFKPDPLDSPPPPIYLGGVGPAMTAVAGEVSDGLMTHPTNTTPRYLREVVKPRLAKGAARSGRDPESVDLMVGPLVATGPTAGDVAAERERMRQMLTFLYSTPSYWPSLEIFGWKDRGERLHALTREGRWADMKDVVDDEMLDTFSPSATYDEIPGVLREWYDGLTDWILFPMPDDPARDPDVAKVLERLRSGS
jgi:probable F420-dependent oxidoreductase